MRVDRVAEAKVTVNRSRFFARFFPAGTLEEVQAEVLDARRRVRKARHHCWACRLVVGGAPLEQARDDGEVGHPGAILLDLLRRHELEGGVVVSRVFGGVKLGVGGVSRAFREAAEKALAELLGRSHTATT